MRSSATDRNARRRLAVLAAVTASSATLLTAPMPALAQGCTGQPGTSALEQYCEAVPRGDGGRDRPGGSGSNGSGSGSGVSSSTQRTLSQAGADGAAVAALASGGSGSGGSGEGASKKSSKSSTKKSSGGSSSGSAGSQDAGAVKAERVESPADPSGNPLKAATNAASSGPVAGPTLVWGLVGMTAIGAIAAVILRRRTPLAPPGDDES